MLVPKLNFLGRLGSFHGRASRGEFYLIAGGAHLYAGLASMILSRHWIIKEPDGTISFVLPLGPIITASIAFMVVPILAVIERRAYDFGKTSKVMATPFLFYFAATILSVAALAYQDPASFDFVSAVQSKPNLLVQIVGVGTYIAILMILSRPSDPEANQYGPNPYEVPT